MKSFVRSVIMFQALVMGYMIVAARKKATFEREKQNKEKSSKSSHYQFQTVFILSFLKSQAHMPMMIMSQLRTFQLIITGKIIKKA